MSHSRARARETDARFPSGYPEDADYFGPDDPDVLPCLRETAEGYEVVTTEDRRANTRAILLLHPKRLKP